MCGRFALHTPASKIAKRYFQHQMPVGDLVSRYNIAPGTQIHTVYNDSNSQLQFTLSYWGFKPAWAAEGAPAPINARIEKLRSPYFREAFAHHRCIIPASGWYEWMATDHGKQPYYITKRGLERDEVIWFAGIYTQEEEKGAPSVAIITEPSCHTIGHIHSRQPVTLADESIRTWLNCDRDPISLKGEIQRVKPESFIFWQISTDVNKADNDYAELIQR